MEEFKNKKEEKKNNKLKKKEDKEIKRKEYIKFMLNALEMRLEKTNNRIRIAESLNMSTSRLRMSAKIDRFMVDLCYYVLYDMMFTVHINNSNK